MQQHQECYARILLGSFLALACIGSACADSIRLYKEGAVPDPAVVARILGKARKHLTRGLSGPEERDGMSPGDPGETISEDDIRRNAVAAVAAWRERVTIPSPVTQNLERTVRAPVKAASAVGSVSTANDAIAYRSRTTPVTSTQSKTRPATLSVASAQSTAVPSTSMAAPAVPSTSMASAQAPAGPVEPSAASAQSTARPAAIALLVNFANDSAQLPPQALLPLDAVAEGLKLAGYERRIAVEGHANAVGSKPYNARLSKRRAESVKRYLVEKHGIPEYALVVMGFGSAQPLNRRNPTAAENRRVQFRPLEV
jgi:outer membrane protein OmpA-like peptidoglycan-associated protein